MYDYGARHYDPSLGRWFVVDPLAGMANQISFTPYHYTWNNPINYTDPDGRNPIVGIPILYELLVGAGVITGIGVLSFTPTNKSSIGEFGHHSTWVEGRGNPPSGGSNGPNKSYSKGTVIVLTLIARLIHNYSKGTNPEMDKMVDKLNSIDAKSLEKLAEEDLALFEDILNHPERYTRKQLEGYYNRDKVVNEMIKDIHSGQWWNHETESNEGTRTEENKIIMQSVINLPAGVYTWDGNNWIPQN